MNKNSVVYLMSGKAHLPYLAVSLQSLTANWGDYDIRIYAWPESFPIAQRIARGTQLQIFEREPEYRGKNDQFLDKIRMMDNLDCPIGLYLDADTIIDGTLSWLFEMADRYGFCATQFSQWNTTGGVIQNRLRRMIDREPINQVSVNRVLSENWPSINGGVFSCKPNNEVLRTWYDWSYAIKDVFIADETALHAVAVTYLKQKKLAIQCGGLYNMSPKYKPRDVDEDDVVVWHGHGDSFIRPNKSPKGTELWLPRLNDLLYHNTFGINEWIDECVACSGSTARFLKEMEVRSLDDSQRAIAEQS